MSKALIVKSMVSEVALESLTMIGIVDKLNINGYHISVDGIKGKEKDDEPSKHIVTITRNQYIATLTKNELKKLTSDEKEEIFNEQSKHNLDFFNKEGITITSEITHGIDNYLWYQNKVEIEFNRTVIETLEGYTKRIVEYTADYVIKVFETMLESGKES